MKLLALAMSSIFVAGLAEGAIKYKCDGEWVDYWPCDKEQVEHSNAIQALKDEYSARASEPEPVMNAPVSTLSPVSGCGSEDVKCFADKARSDALIPCKHSIESGNSDNKCDTHG